MPSSPSAKPPASSSPPDPSAPSARRLHRLSRFMDSAITLPGGYRVGWDGIIGLIPGFGDIVGLAVSAWIVLGAARLGASRATLARMAGNVAIESLVGTVPVLGDLFDFVFKANERNMRLLERHLDEPERLERHSRRWLSALAVIAVALVLLVGWLVLALLGALFGLVFGAVR